MWRKLFLTRNDLHRLALDLDSFEFILKKHLVNNVYTILAYKTLKRKNNLITMKQLFLCLK